MRATGPGQPAHLLLDVADHLAQRHIPYAVVGAFGVSFHGLPRFTDDADARVWLSRTGLSPADLQHALAASGHRCELRRGDTDDPILGVLVVHDDHGNRLDLLLGVRGMDPAAADRAIATSLLGSPVRILGAEDLVAMKAFAGGVQDLEDARGILDVSKDHLDLDLVRALCRRYGRDVARTCEALLTS